MAFSTTVSFVHEEHFAEGFFERLLRLRPGIPYIFTDQIGRGYFKNFRRGKEAYIVVYFAYLSSRRRFASTYYPLESWDGLYDCFGAHRADHEIKN